MSERRASSQTPKRRFGSKANSEAGQEGGVRSEKNDHPKSTGIIPPQRKERRSLPLESSQIRRSVGEHGRVLPSTDETMGNIGNSVGGEEHSPIDGKETEVQLPQQPPADQVQPVTVRTDRFRAEAPPASPPDDGSRAAAGVRQSALHQNRDAPSTSRTRIYPTDAADRTMPDQALNVFMGELSPDEERGAVIEAVDVHPLEESGGLEPCLTRGEKLTLGCSALLAAVGLAVGLSVGIGRRPAPQPFVQDGNYTCDVRAAWKKIGLDVTHRERFSDATWVGYVASLARTFGSTVSLSRDGNRLAVSGRFDDGASVYELDTGGRDWVQLGEDLTVGSKVLFYSERELYDALSTTVISGDGTRIAATFPRFTDDAAVKNKGLVAIYKYVGDGSWVQVGDDFLGSTANTYLGDSGTVDFSDDGGVIAIGDYRYGSRTGRVKVFRYEREKWAQLGEDIYGEDNGIDFGTKVSLSADGMALAVAAPYAQRDHGLVKVFRYEEEKGWVPVGSTIEGGERTCGFGDPLSFNSDASRIAVYGSGPLPPNQRCIAFVEAGNNVDNRGVVTVYELVDEEWREMGPKIVGDEGGVDFGWAIDLSGDGNTLAVGAKGSRKNGNESGNVRTYRYVGGNWTQAGKDIEGPSSGDWAGASVSLSRNGERLAVGAPTDFLVPQETSGTATVFGHCWS